MDKCFILLSFIFYSKEVYSNDELSADKILNREALTAILNNLDTNANWSRNLNKNILYDKEKHQDLVNYIDRNYYGSDGKIEEFNVLSVLQKYDQDEDRDSNVNFDVIRGLIQDAITCTGLTNLSLFGFLLLRDLLPFTNSLINKYEQPTNNDASQNDIINLINIINEVYVDEEEIQRLQQVYDDYRMNFGVSTKNGQIEFKAMGKLLKNKLDINSAWKSTIRKSATLDIDYCIDSKALLALFKCRETAKPVVVDLFEIVLILLYVAKAADDILEGTCVAHSGSFVKKYKSLGHELGEEFLLIIKNWDEKSLDLTEWGLYLIFSQFVDTPEKSRNTNQNLYPFYIKQAKFKDENTEFSWKDNEEYVKKNRYLNGTNRKLSFGVFSEEYDGSGDENSDKQESSNKSTDDENSVKKESDNLGSDDEKASDVYYRFNGRVNIDLS